MRAVLTWLVLALAGAAASSWLSDLAALLPSALTEGLDDLVRVAAETCEILPLEVIFSRQRSFEIPHLDVVAFTRNTKRQYRIKNANKIYQEHNRHGQPFILYIPGWWNTPTDESSQAIVQALLTKHRVIMVLDTRLSFCRGYVSAASRVKALAQILYDLITKLDIRGLHPENIHLIGFSLGAHVAGITGKLVRNNMNRKLQMITALDPAKPCFARTVAYRLDSRDASFVQVIHTSAGVLGLEEPIGHTDVYMNGISGSQPECQGERVTLECDHAQAWKLYAASVIDEKSLVGYSCNSWNELKKGECKGDLMVLGYGCNTTTRGLYLYKSTNLAKRTVKPEVRRDIFGVFRWLM